MCLVKNYHASDKTVTFAIILRNVLNQFAVTVSTAKKKQGSLRGSILTSQQNGGFSCQRKNGTVMINDAKVVFTCNGERERKKD